MDPRVYNVSLLAGVALVGVGAGLVSVPAGLIVTGALILGFTVYSTWRGP